MDKQELLDILKKGEEAERIYAIEDILEFKDEKLYPVIIKHIYEEDSRLVRELVVEALKVLDVSEHFGEIAKYFESSEAYIRNCAIEIFGSKGEDAVPYLTSIMDHENKEVRKLVLDSLVATSSKYSIPALRAALKDKAPNVMITAVEYLGKIYDEESLADIIEIFENIEEPMTKISCLETLIIMGNASIVDRVLTSVGGKGMDSFFKPSVFRLVGEKGDLRHLDFLLHFLNNKNTMYFKELANGILKIISRADVHELDEEHTKFIINNLTDRDGMEDERITLLYIVSKLNIDCKEAIYEELTSDVSETIVLQAFEYLAGINNEKAVRLLEKKIKMAEPELKALLSNMLESLKEK